MREQILTGRDVLRLMADGLGIDEFQHRPTPDMEWAKVDRYWPAEPLRTASGQFRRKPKTRVINGFTETPQRGQEVFVAFPTNKSWHMCDNWCGADIDRLRLQRGLLFWDMKNAIATAKAMCGIDPSKE